MTEICSHLPHSGWNRAIHFFPKDDQFGYSMQNQSSKDAPLVLLPICPHDLATI